MIRRAEGLLMDVQALEVDASCVKALYWRARANEKLELHDNALVDLKVCGPSGAEGVAYMGKQ